MGSIWGGVQGWAIIYNGSRLAALGSRAAAHRLTTPTADPILRAPSTKIPNGLRHQRDVSRASAGRSSLALPRRPETGRELPPWCRADGGRGGARLLGEGEGQSRSGDGRLRGPRAAHR